LDDEDFGCGVDYAECRAKTCPLVIFCLFKKVSKPLAQVAQLAQTMPFTAQAMSQPLTGKGFPAWCLIRFCAPNIDMTEQ
jgi:hypothetical protein